MYALPWMWINAREGKLYKNADARSWKRVRHKCAPGSIINVYRCQYWANQCANQCETIRKPTLQADQHCFEYFLIFTPTISEECCLHVVLVFKYFKKKAVTTIVEELLSLYFHKHHFPATSGQSLCFIECQQVVSHHAGSPAVCSGGRLLHLTATV